MGQPPDSHFFVPLTNHPEAQERPGKTTTQSMHPFTHPPTSLPTYLCTTGIKVYKLTGYLWYGNATKMRDQLDSFMSEAAKNDKGACKASSPSPFLPFAYLLSVFPLSIHLCSFSLSFLPNTGLTHIVLDFSGSSGLDLTTVLSLQHIVNEAQKLKVRLPLGPPTHLLTHLPTHLSAHTQVTLLLAECSDAVMRNLEASDLLKDVGGQRAKACLEDVVDAIAKEKEEATAFV